MVPAQSIDPRGLDLACAIEPGFFRQPSPAQARGQRRVQDLDREVSAMIEPTATGDVMGLT